MGRQWEIRLFNGLSACDGTRELRKFRTQKTASLLAYLAYHPRAHARETLMQQFWPASDTAAARHNLRMALSSLRHQLESEGWPPGSVLHSDRALISFQRDIVTTDVGDFTAAFAKARRSPEAATTCWTNAVDAYGGTLLSGFYDEWIAPEQRHLEELFFQALHEAVRALERAGDVEGALQYAARGPIVDPLRETAQRDLIRLYAAQQPALALRHYHELEHLLRDQLDCRPDARTTALIAHLQKAPASTCSAPATGQFHAPLPCTRFFGREAEIAQLQILLRDSHTRLVTLSGPSGSGKTRLAQQAVAPIAAQWAGGAWLVELADLPDANLLVSALLEKLKLRPAPDLDPLDELVNFLRRQPILLLLDSFEHLVAGGAPIVAQLLARVAGLTCLVTSQRPLHLAGERILAVPPLPVAHATASNSASVHLFVDRARAVQPQFALTAANAPQIAQLCERLEGMPLAIELAAARCGALTVAEMLRHLEHRFDFLVSRQRDATSRHRSLWAAIDGSYRLLSPDLQKFFARLSVFRGGCTLEAAQLFAEKNQALEALETLCDCSLVVAREQHGAMRFHVLDSLREFGLQVLAGPEYALWQRQHAEFFTALAARNAKPRILDAEQDNLRAALEWSLAHDAELAWRLAVALTPFWEQRCQIAEAQSWLERARQCSGPTQWRARVLHACGRIAFVQGDATAQTLLEAALQLFRAPADRALIASSLSMLGVIVLNRGEFENAQKLFDQQLAVWPDETALPADAEERLEAQRGSAAALAQRGNLAVAQCDFATALPILERAATHFRALHDDNGLAYVLDALGQMASLQGEREKARVCLDRSLALYRGLEETLWSIRALWGRGHLAHQEGDDKAALAFYREGIGIACRNRNRLSIPYLLEAIGALEIARGRAGRGTHLLGAAQALRDEIGVKIMPIWESDYQIALVNARQLLGEAAFERHWSQGFFDDWEAAAAFARQDSFKF